MCLGLVYLVVVGVFRGCGWPAGRRLGTGRRSCCYVTPARCVSTAAGAQAEIDLGRPGSIAALTRVIPRPQRAGLRLVVTPHTILRWHRDLLRRRWAARCRAGRSGRPVTRGDVRRLVLRLAGENPPGGIGESMASLPVLASRIAPSTVWEILTRAGIDPASRRTGPSWAQFCIRPAHSGRYPSPLNRYGCSRRRRLQPTRDSTSPTTSLATNPTRSPAATTAPTPGTDHHSTGDGGNDPGGNDDYTDANDGRTEPGDGMPLEYSVWCCDLMCRCGLAVGFTPPYPTSGVRLHEGNPRFRTEWRGSGSRECGAGL
jgi:hypothetical protein